MKLMLNGKEVSGMGHYVMAGDIKDATAEDSNVLSGKTYYNNNGKREGTMPNRGGMSAELAAGGSTTIPEGYHNGEGVVRAQDLASQTEGTMTEETLSVGETGWVNGKQITGSLVVPVVNDWDPYEMEEEVMLDLSGYTFVGSGDSTSITITPNADTICIGGEAGIAVRVPRNPTSTNAGVNDHQIAFLSAGTSCKFNVNAKSIWISGQTSIWQKL